MSMEKSFLSMSWMSTSGICYPTTSVWIRWRNLVFSNRTRKWLSSLVWQRRQVIRWVWTNLWLSRCDSLNRGPRMEPIVLKISSKFFSLIITLLYLFVFLLYFLCFNFIWILIKPCRIVVLYKKKRNLSTCKRRVVFYTI